MTAIARSSMIDPEEKKRVAKALGTFVRTFLVAGRAGAPAEGRLPFNPLNFHLLEQLADHGAMRPSDLAAALGVPRSTLSSAISALEKRQLVTKEPDPDDGRAKRVSLLDEGQHTADAIKRQNLMNAGVVLALLDERDQTLFCTMIEKAAERLSELNDSSKQQEN